MSEGRTRRPPGGLAEVSVVVCHYNADAAPHIRHMALHAMAFLRKEPAPELRMLLVDGSPQPDGQLADALARLDVEYLHCGMELSFGATYNAGIRATATPTVVTMANDVLIEPQQLRLLAAEVRDGVGCAIPYLTESDYSAQRTRPYPVPRRCFPTRMTLNVNAFPREALETVGLIPEQMSGCFNDVVLAIKLREHGYRIVLRNVGRVVHLAQQTLKTGASRVSLERDAQLFKREYPHYCREGVVLFHKVAQRRLTRLLYRAAESLPGSLAGNQRLWNTVWTLEPYLCAERGAFRERMRRALRGSPRA